MSDVLTIVLACIGSSGLFTLIQYLIQRHDHKTDYLAMFEAKLNQIERETCRCQLLIMMNHYKSEKCEILKLAQHYFVDLNGDFYMTSIFQKWLSKNEIEKPTWFSESK